MVFISYYFVLLATNTSNDFGEYTALADRLRGEPLSNPFERELTEPFYLIVFWQLSNLFKAETVVKDETGNIKEIHCTYSEDTTKKVKGTLHWVSIKHAIKAEVREYDRLFMDESPDSHQDKNFMEFINPNSLKVIEAYVEPSLSEAKVGDRFQFQRLGYFNVDNDSNEKLLIFNKTVGLRDTWTKQEESIQTSNKSASQHGQNQPKNNQNQPQRKPLDIIQQLGKKYTNLPETKQLKAKSEIQKLAENVSYEELEPLFSTAAKKVGTRIATMITLGVLLKNGLKINAEIEAFIQKGLEDTDALLVAEASAV